MKFLLTGEDYFRADVKRAKEAGRIEDPAALIEALALKHGVSERRAVEIFKQEGGDVEPIARPKLRRRAILRIWIGLALALPVFLCVGLISVSIPSGGDFFAVIGGVLRISGIIVMGMGMADLAQAKGHSRDNGWWVLLFLIGLWIVAVLPDKNRFVDASDVNPRWPLPPPKTEENRDSSPKRSPDGAAVSQGVERASDSSQGCSRKGASCAEPDFSDDIKAAGEGEGRLQETTRPKQRISDAATIGDQPDVVAQLGQLGELRASGQLSDEEFTRAKAILLGLSDSAPARFGRHIPSRPHNQEADKGQQVGDD